MSTQRTTYLIKFKLKNTNPAFLNENTGLVDKPEKATHYTTKDEAFQIASRLMGLPKNIRIIVVEQSFPKAFEATSENRPNSHIK